MTISKDSGSVLERLRELVREVPDFPKAGISFKDITPILSDHSAFHDAIVLLAEPFAAHGIDAVLGIESRGFMFAAPIALRLGAAFVPVRKPGKLPHLTDRAEYALEYGTDALEIHRDALAPGARVLIVDDVIATGGTAGAAVALAKKQGAEVIGATFLIELAFLGGMERLGIKGHSLLRYG